MKKYYHAIACSALCMTGSLGSPSPARAAGVTLPEAPRCPIFPASNVWNQDVSALPVAPNSTELIRSVGLDRGLHPDFGTSRDSGIPYNVVTARQPRAAVHFGVADESDKGPYPIPPHPSIELSSDRHLLLVDRDACRLYELYGIHHTTGGWQASSGAIWNLRSNALRPAGWTSADGAGLPILPGLVRYGEVARGIIRHAFRFTTMPTRHAFIYPARHYASTRTDSSLPPMGLRVRLKASVNLSGFSQENRVILQALKRYGMLLADNGQPWFITGVPDSRWKDDDLHHLNRITGADLEVVDTSTLHNGSVPSGQPPTPTQETSPEDPGTPALSMNQG